MKNYERLRMPSKIHREPLRAQVLEHASICFWKDEMSKFFAWLKDILDLMRQLCPGKNIS